MGQHLDLVFIRHGEPAARRGVFLGRTDPPLDAHGRQQAWDVAASVEDALHGHPPANLLVSPLLRTRQSAEPVAERFGITASFDNRLQEIDFGRWDGLDHHQIRSLDPAGPNSWLEDPVNVRPGGGENFRDVRHRLEPFFAELVASEPHSPVLIVAHFGVIANLAALALQLPVEHAERLRLGRGQAGRIHHGRLCWWGLPAMPPADRRVYGDRRA
jgi:broad specificity phosphatase PhoE